MPPPTRILDSHIHLWPHSAANTTQHAWMAPGGPLSSQHSLADYAASTARDPALRGAVYVETDRILPADSDPTTAPSSSSSIDILARAAAPLEELRWLRRLVEGTPLAGEGFAAGDGGAALWGLVPWAPVDAANLDDFARYLAAAQEACGPAAWARVRGWRFLVQGIVDEGAFRRKVESAAWVACLRECGRRGWCFDVGVDARQAGVWQVERAVEMCERVNERGSVGEGEEVRFILNHLCKPDMEQHPTTPAQIDAFNRWAACIERASRSPHVYMKLSGAFSEIADQDPDAPWSPDAVLERMRPWLDKLFDAFPPERIMFGSDWPVCNVRGPGKARAWQSWKAAVERILDAYGLTDEQRDRVWYGTAVEAYRLSPPK